LYITDGKSRNIEWFYLKDHGVEESYDHNQQQMITNTLTNSIFQMMTQHKDKKDGRQ
jgi:hypothetical protein